MPIDRFGVQQSQVARVLWFTDGSPILTSQQNEKEHVS
jgi:hypothetical protein